MPLTIPLYFVMIPCQIPRIKALLWDCYVTIPVKFPVSMPYYGNYSISNYTSHLLLVTTLRKNP